MKNVNKHLIFLLLAALLFGTVLTACGGEDPTPTPQSSDDDDDNDAPPVEEPTDEPTPTEEPTPVPTDTPTPEPTETPDPTAGFTDFSNDVLGISLSYPSEWAIEFDEAASELKLASSQEILDDEQDVIKGAILNVLFLDRELLSILGGEDLDPNDPVAVLGLFSELFTQQSDSDVTMTVTEEPTAVTINGQDGAQVLADASDADGNTAVMKILLIMSETRVGIVVSGSEVSEEDQNRPVLDAIENTIVLSTPVGAPTIETGGPTELPESSGFLLYGDAVDGTVDETGPSVWDFVGLEGEVIDIIVEPAGDFDVVVDVVDETGTSILPNGEVDAAFGTEEILELTIPASGSYYIVVRGFADATGDYQLTIAEAGTAVVPPVTGGDGEAIEYGDFVSGAVDGANPVASYSFSGAEDDVVGMVITPFDDFDAVVDVVDAAGNSLLPRERDASFGSENVLVFLPADGVYTVNVYGFEGSEGSFDLQMSTPLTNVVYAASDTLEAEDEGEGHSFPFTALRTGDMVGIYVEPAEDLDVAIQVRQDGELLDGMGFDPERGFDASVDVEQFVMIAEDSGTYSFRVLNSQDDFAGNTGDYDVTLFGTAEIVFELAYGDSVDARTNPDGLVDYVISGFAGDTIVVNVASDNDDVDMVIEILDLDENVLASIDDGFSGEVEELTYTFENEDLVIIRVRDFFGAEGDFVMTVDLQ